MTSEQRDLYSILRAVDIAPPTRQFVGLPQELSESVNERQAMPQPRILVIEHREDRIFLLRYSREGTFAGDTWHLSVDDAQNQADHEYGALVGQWIPIPDEVAQPLELALEQLRSPEEEER